MSRVDQVIQPCPLRDAYLRLFLDADRDGEIDDEPADYDKWEWGRGGSGGIITVPYKDAQGAWWRTPLIFRRTKELTGEWKAFLTIDKPGLIRMYTDRSPTQRGWTDGAQELPLGDSVKAAKTLDLHDITQFWGDIRAGRDSCIWVQARRLPALLRKDDAEVRVTFEFRGADNVQQRQTAVLRIAPWIMSSDLDTVDRVYVIGSPAGNQIAEQVQAFVGNANITVVNYNNTILKPFVRDVMKSGFISEPRKLRVAVLSPLDADDLGQGRPTYTKAVVTSVLTRPAELADTVTLADTVVANSQDNGGNLMVSPPVRGFPFGRIIYGENLLAEGDDVQSSNCKLSYFFQAQAVQKPIVIDTGWLSVGHSDEMLSFIPDSSKNRNRDFPYKVLLGSPRLALILCLLGANPWIANTPDYLDWTAAPGKWAGDADVLSLEAVFAAADRINVAVRAAVSRHISGRTPDEVKRWLRANSLTAPNVSPIHTSCASELEGADAVYSDTDLNPDLDPPEYKSVARPAYDADPQPVARVPGPGGRQIGVFNGYMVYWSASGVFSQAMAGRPVAGGNNYFAVRLDTFLRKMRLQLDNMVESIQPRIDHSRYTLMSELGVRDDDIIEIPVIYHAEAGTADSVNLLIASTGDNHRCLIPKPFGPVCDRKYLFEEYIRARLQPLGVPFEFANDWDRFHSHEGEIHCGTNQIPAARSVMQWWECDEPEWP